MCLHFDLASLFRHFEKVALEYFLSQLLCWKKLRSLQLRLFRLNFVTAFLMDISEHLAMTRMASKIFTVTFQIGFVEATYNE